MASTSQAVSVIGAGYVGLTTAVLFAEAGYKVYLIELNQDRLAAIKAGRSFFYELGINPLLKHSLKTGKLIPTDLYESSIPDSSIIFSCVGTPDNPDGSSNLDYVFAAAEEAAKYLAKGSIYVQKSTVPVGTGAHVEAKMKKQTQDFSYVSNPEFLREGTAVADSLWFDRVIVGGNNKQAVKTIIDLYKSLESHRQTIAERAGIRITDKKAEGNYIATDLNSAELIKVTANAFLALKISFANSIAKLADHADADINDVMSAVGADHRIGRAFLNAGRGYGGGCFPKDVSGLISSANEFGVDLQIMTAAYDLNDSMPGYIVNKSKNFIGKLQNKKVAVLGLAFKAGTSDARKSPGVKIANLLAQNGAKVKVYDPKANDESRDKLVADIIVAAAAEEAVKGADAVFIATDWPEFINYDLKSLADNMSGDVLIDCMNIYKIDSVENCGLRYIGVGRNGKVVNGK